MPVMPTWSSKLGHLEWHVSWAFWATGPDPLLVKSTSCRNVRVGPLLRLKTAPEPGMAIPVTKTAEAGGLHTQGAWVQTKGRPHVKGSWGIAQW